jgi:hypothetical protein
LGCARFFEHSSERCGTVDQLRRRNSGDSTSLLEVFAEIDNAASEVERTVTDVLSVFVGRMRITRRLR